MTELYHLTWNIFHKISLYYNESYKNFYITFFETFKKIIPCKICRNHYIEYMNNNFYENIDKGTIFYWTIDLHNNINSINNKRLWNYDEAKEYYANYDSNLNMFLYIYITNFKNKENKEELILMIKSIPYVYYDINKKKELIKFSENFELNCNNMKDWLIAFIIIIKYSFS